MKRFILSTAIILLAHCPVAVGGSSVSQETKGNCAPAIFTENQKGDVKIEISCYNLDPALRKLLSQALAKLENIPDLSDKIDQLREEILSALREQQLKHALDTQHIEEIIALRYRHVFKSSAEEASEWMKELLYSSPAKTADLKAASASGKALAEKLSLKAQPFFDWVVKQVDDRAAELHKNGLLARLANPKHEPYYKNTSAPIYVANGGASQRVYIVDLRFPAGGTYILFLQQGRILRGKRAGSPRLYTHESAPGLPFQNRKFQLILDGDFAFTWSGRVHTPTTRDPLLDANFRRTISQAIGTSLRDIYLNDAAGR